MSWCSTNRPVIDLESIEALQESLQEYDGTVVVVGRDRSSSTKLLLVLVNDQGITDYRGTYSRYRTYST